MAEFTLLIGGNGISYIYTSPQIRS